MKIFQSDKFLPIIFFLLIMLVYPGMIFCVEQWNVMFFEAGTIILLIAGLMLFHPMKLFLSWKHLPSGLRLAYLILFGLAAYHMGIHQKTYMFQEKGLLFLTTLLPLSVCCFASGFLSMITPALSFLWLHDAIFSYIEYYGLHWHAFGLPQNVNWNASYLAATAPFAVLWCWRLKKIPRVLRVLTASVIIAATLLMVFLTQSRGAALAILLVMGCLAFLYVPQKFRLSLLLGILGFALIGSIVFSIKMPMDKLTDYLARDERLYFARTTMDMIIQRPLCGYGGPSFETEYLPFRTADFFTMRYSAARVDHPHNHFLYMAASFGLIGLLAWLYLLGEPILHGFRRFRELSSEVKLALLCLVGMLIHAQFDLILYRWPTNLIAMVFLGILWHERISAAHAPFWTPPSRIRAIQTRATRLLYAATPPGLSVRILMRLLGLTFTIGALFSAAGNLRAEILAKIASQEEERGDMQSAAKHYLEAASIYSSTLNLRSQAFAFASLHDPGSIYRYLSFFASSSTPDYGLIHDYAALAHVHNGHPDLAVPHLKRAMELRPLSVIPLIMLADTYTMMDMPGAEEAVRERLAAVMMYRNLDNDDLHTILQNQDLDLSANFKRYPKDE